jgi:hypothetical protein
VFFTGGASGTTHCMHRLWVASGSMTIGPTHLMVGYLGYRRAVLSLAGRARGGRQACKTPIKSAQGSTVGGMTSDFSNQHRAQVTACKWERVI